MTTTASEHAPMFTDEAWEAGWHAAESAGLTTMFAPAMRPLTRRNVEEIVSAVVNHGFEELYVEQLAEDGWLKSLPAEAVERMRSHMLRRLAVETAEHRSVMLTLPREITDHPEPGITRIRLIVPVRRIGPAGKLCAGLVRTTAAGPGRNGQSPSCAVCSNLWLRLGGGSGI